MFSGSKPWATILVRFSDSPGVTPKPKSYFDGLMGAQDAGGRRVDFSRFCGCNLLLEHSRQKLKRITQDGVALNVPEDPPRYLERLYGPGWTKPDGGWLWYVHQRPIEIRGNPLSLAYCWFRIEILRR